MKPTKAIGSLFLALFCLSLVSAKCGKEKEGEISKAPEDPVWIKVNGQAIRKSSIQPDIDRRMDQFQKQAGDQVPAEQLEMIKPMIKRQAMREAAQKAVLDMAVEKEGITAKPEEVEKELNKLKANFPDDSSFKQKLSELKLTEKDLKEDIAANLRYLKLFEKNVKVEPPTEEEIKNVYEQAKDRLKTPAKLKVTHILTTIPAGASDETKAELKKKAEEARKRALAGEDMAALASEYSDAPSKANGGKEEFVKGQTISPEFEEAVFALKPGQVSEVIESPIGFHVVRVDEVIPESVMPLEEVRDKIVEYLERQKKEPLYQQYLDKLMKEAKVEYVEPLPENPMMPGTAPAPAQSPPEQPPAEETAPSR